MARKKLKILFVAEVSHIGGAQTAIEELANQLNSYGHGVSIIQGVNREKIDWSKGYLHPKIKVINFKVDFRGNIRVFSSIALGIWTALSRLSVGNSYDLIILNYALSAGITCLHPNYRKTQKIFLFHGDEPKIMWSMIPKPRRHKILGLIKRALVSGPFIAAIFITQRIGLHLSTYIVGFSKYTQRVLVNELGMGPDKVYTSSLGVNTGFFKSSKYSKSRIKQELGFSGKQNIVLCTSRFEHRKGIDFLLDAFSRVNKSLPDSHLVLTTPIDEYYLSSPYFLKILQKINDLKLSPKIQILFNLTRHELIKYYQAADVLVFPSRNLETFGLIALEALACHLPTVTYSKSGGPREIIKRVTPALIFNKYTEVEAAEKIKLAFNLNKKDFSAKADELVSEYPWTKPADLLVKLAS